MESANVKIHPSADVQTENIGEGTVVWQNAVVLSGAVIGKNCNINSQTFIENDVVIGDNVTLKCGVYLWDGIRVQNNVFIGPNATFVNDKLPRSKQFQQTPLIIKIEEGATIGANATVVSEVTIGRFAMIGGGTVVTKTVYDHELIVGVPGVLVGYVCDCGCRLNDLLACADCGKTFQKCQNGLEGMDH